MIHCTKCGTKIIDENLRVHSSYSIDEGLESDSIDVEATCPKCKHEMWARIHQEDIMDVL